MFERRFEMVFNWAIEALATFELRTTNAGPVDDFVDELVAMLTAGLGAESHHARAHPAPIMLPSDEQDRGLCDDVRQV